MRLSMRRAVLCAMLAGSVIVVPATAASAHVHGITPLSQCDEVPENAGANQTDDTAADGTINGLIPKDVGSSQLTAGDGGADAPVQCP